MRASPCAAPSIDDSVDGELSFAAYMAPCPPISASPTHCGTSTASRNICAKANAEASPSAPSLLSWYVFLPA